MAVRTIIFRGKRIDNGEWVCGFIVKMFGTYHIIDKDDENTAYEVIPETVGQHTGLKDKNGKRIFEGDILSIPFEEDRSPYEENSIYYENGEVYFDTERYGWYVRFREYNDEISLWEYDNTDIEVISNIYDNPELLKGGNQ